MLAVPSRTRSLEKVRMCAVDLSAFFQGHMGEQSVQISLDGFAGRYSVLTADDVHSFIQADQ